MGMGKENLRKPMGKPKKSDLKSLMMMAACQTSVLLVVFVLLLFYKVTELAVLY